MLPVTPDFQCHGQDHVMKIQHQLTFLTTGLNTSEIVLVNTNVHLELDIPITK